MPTPSASSYGSNQSPSAGAKVRHSLESMARHAMWPTPTTQDAKNNGWPSQMRRNSLPLNAAVKFPTPTASMADRGGRGDLLQVVRGNPSPSQRWRTPKASDAPHSGRKAPAKPGQTVSLDQQVNGLEHTPGRLNPTWVEWLMGFPLGWTDCEPSGTPSSPRSLSGSDTESSTGKAA